MSTDKTAAPAHHIVADLEAEDALIDIIISAKAATEKMNRRIGQITRYTLARIELARREGAAL